MIENKWTRGIFRTRFGELPDGKFEVTHRCVVCGFEAGSISYLWEDYESLSKRAERINSILLSHESLHPGERFVCDWWRFKGDMHMAGMKMNLYFGTEILTWRN